LLAKEEYYWRKLLAGVLILLAMGSGVTGIFLQPVIMGIAVYLAVSTKRHTWADAGLMAASLTLLFTSLRFFGPVPLSADALGPGFSWIDVISWMFVMLIVLKVTLFIGSAALVATDVRAILEREA
jgi:hypothetical protein